MLAKQLARIEFAPSRQCHQNREDHHLTAEKISKSLTGGRLRHSLESFPILALPLDRSVLH